MTVKKIAAIILGLLAFTLPLYAATITVSGTNVQDTNGLPLFSGQWCFNSTCLTVTNGAFSGTVTSGTNTVTVVNASSVTILTLTPITLSANYAWNGFTVPQTITYTGNGAPYLACQLAASYTQEDSTPVGAVWTCISQSGRLVWSFLGPPTPVGPGIVSGYGVPTIQGVVPTIYLRTDTNATYALSGLTGSISSTWYPITGSGSPSGADFSIQYNNGGAFGGAGFTGVTFNNGTSFAPSAATSPQIVTALNASPSSTLAPALLPLATTGAFGVVKPDGSTITISAGVISSTGSCATCLVSASPFTTNNTLPYHSDASSDRNFAESLIQYQAVTGSLISSGTNSFLQFDYSVLGAATAIIGSFTDPSGSCSSLPVVPMFNFNGINGSIFYCPTSGGSWTSFGGSAGGGLNSITCASSITFSAAAAINYLPLGCNVTSSTIPSGTLGACTTIQVAQGGAFTLAWPATMHGVFAPAFGAGTYNSGRFCWDQADSVWLASGAALLHE